MSRSVFRFLAYTLLASGIVVCPAARSRAGQNAPASPGVSSVPSKDSSPPTGTASGVMQVKKLITGDFTYRFVSTKDTAGAVSMTAPVPLPSSAGTDNLSAIAIPKTYLNGQLQILDSQRGNISMLPVTTQQVATLSESSFTLAQRVNVPVQAKGLGVVGAQVVMSSADKKFNQTRLLQPDDNGIARFDNVPLNVPVTVTVSYASNPVESQTKTLTVTRPAEVWAPIMVNWPDAKTVTPPPPVVPSAASSHDASSRTASDSDTRSSRREEPANPINTLVSTIISLLLLGGIGYGLFWAYKTGRIKTFLDRVGISTEPVAATGAGAIPDPFARQKNPIQPITEGTADPFAGGTSAGISSAMPVMTGPRLVATVGTYSGQIFPLNSPASDIGRDAANAVPLPNDTNASRRHATLQNAGGQYTITDNGSSNGTFLNGVKIAAQSPQPLRSGDEVQIGMTRFRFEA